MKITDLVPGVSPHGRPTINLAKTGMISLSSAACKLIGLQAGDDIILSFDEDRPTDFFIRKGNSDDKKLILRKTYDNKGKALIVQCAAVVHDIFRRLKIDTKTVVFPISREPFAVDGVNYFAIITHATK